MASSYNTGLNNCINSYKTPQLTLQLLKLSVFMFLIYFRQSHHCERVEIFDLVSKTKKPMVKINIHILAYICCFFVILGLCWNICQCLPWEILSFVNSFLYKLLLELFDMQLFQIWNDKIEEWKIYDFKSFQICLENDLVPPLIMIKVKYYEIKIYYRWQSDSF